MDTEKKQTAGVTLSLKKAFSLLEVLAEYPNGCTLSKVVEKTQLNKTTVYRLLQSMHSLGYVDHHNTDNQNRYSLSFRTVGLGQRLLHEINIVPLAMPVLNRLHEEIGLTINLKMFQNTHSVILVKLEPQVGNIRTRTYMGMTVNLYSSASGKVFLAYRSKDFVRNYWKTQKHKIKKIQPSTIVNLDVMLKRLEIVHKNEYALDSEENEIGIACIAAPVFDHLGHANYAISIAAQASLMRGATRKKYITDLQKATREISRFLGYEKKIYGG